MEAPNPTGPTVKPPVQSLTTVDTSQLFQKDPEPAINKQKGSFLTRFGKKKRLVLAVPVATVLVGSAFVLAQFSESANKPIVPTVTEEYTSDAMEQMTKEQTSEGSASQPVASDSSNSSSADQPDGSSTMTSNSTSSGSTGTSGGSTTPSGNTGANSTTPKTYNVSYTAGCFIPANVMIKKGDTVKFTNNTTGKMWPASNAHPQHTLYSEFDAGKAVASGSSYSFTFSKIGSWGYHDHFIDTCGGAITVQ